MLNVVAPGRLVLTLQSIPPFVVESIFALTLAILLALPLILRIQHSLDENPMKAKTNWPNRASNLKKIERSEDRVVTHYPVSTFDSASSSSADLLLSTARRTISTPIIQASGDNVRVSRHETEGKTEGTIKRQDMPKQSSSFIVTNAELPIVDISAFDYDAYRYKLIEAALRKQYDDYQPPGDVVLNSIHLNNNDFVIGVKLNDDYHHSLFDFVEEYYDATKGMSKRETEYMHPLDHFLVKGTQRPETAEKETETKRVDVADAADQDEKSTRISFYDDTIVGGSRRQESSKRDTRPRPSSGSAESSASKKSLPHRSSGRKSATKFSRTNSSTDSISSKRETYRGLRTRQDKHEIQSSADGNERESMNYTTVSSIDSESGLSVSSKQRDHSVRSRDSSVASKSRDESEKLWLTGNTRMSFNRKYGATSKLSEAKKKDKTTNKQSKQALPRNFESHQTDLEGPLDRNSKKESIKMNGQQFGRLEAIQSETEELQPNSMANLFIQDLPADSFRRSQYSTNYLSKTCPSRMQSSRVMDPLLGDRQQRLLTQPRISMHERNVEESRVKQQDKLRAPKSRTVSPLTKQSALKKELSSEAFASKEQPGNVPVDPCRENSERKKEASKENIELCSNYIKKQMDQRRTGSMKLNYEGPQCKVEIEGKSSIKSESPVKLNVHGRRLTSGSFRYKGETTKMNASSPKVASDTRKTTYESKNKEEHRTTIDVNSGELNSFGRKPTFDSLRNMEDRKHQDKADSDKFTANGRRSKLDSFRNNNTEDEKMNTERHQRKMKVNSARLNAPTKLNANSLCDKEEGNRVECERRIEVNNEKLNAFGNKEGKMSIENQGRDARLNAYGRRATLDSFPSKDRKEEERLSDFNRRRASSAIRNPIYSKGNVSTIAKSRSLQQRPATGSKIDTGLLHANARSLQIGGAKSSTLSELSSRFERNQGKEAEADDLKLPRQDSKAGIAMQAGLKKYIKKLKRVLSNQDNADIGELASLSLTDALLPDLESTLSSVEVEQVQNLLSMAEKKSELIEKSSGLKSARLKKTVF